MKTCFKCNRKLPLTEFYKHSQMKDGHLNKCKSCTKTDSLNHRHNNLDKIREYDRLRGSRQSKEYIVKYREKYPNKYKAHAMVNSAMRSGKLFREECEVCGEINTHGHHDDYLKPLNVRWLCATHHKEWHMKNGEGKNAN